jgi:hypothetical protein
MGCLWPHSAAEFFDPDLQVIDPDRLFGATVDRARRCPEASKWGTVDRAFETVLNLAEREGCADRHGRLVIMDRPRRV